MCYLDNYLGFFYLKLISPFLLLILLSTSHKLQLLNFGVGCTSASLLFDNFDLRKLVRIQSMILWLSIIDIFCSIVWLRSAHNHLSDISYELYLAVWKKDLWSWTFEFGTSIVCRKADLIFHFLLWTQSHTPLMNHFLN